VFKVDINNELVLPLDINFQGITIHQYTINDIFAYGIEKYNNLLLPYSITLDMLQIPIEEQEKYKIFDFIMYDDNLSSLLINSLIYFCRTDNIKKDKDCIYVDKGLLNRDNFDEFGDIILKIHAQERIKEDKLPENPKQRELELKLRALRARHKSKAEFQLCDIINNVKYGGKYYIPIREVLKMTLWELYNAFNSKLGVDKSDSSLSIALVCGDKNNTLENNHWSKLLKVGK
jgi:hypothetical protein